MHARARILTPLAGAITALLCTYAHGDSIKAANTDALNTPSSWTNGLVPGPSDFAIWDSTITAGNASVLGDGGLSVLGLRITNVGGTRNGTGNRISIDNTAGATLTIGGGGIDMSAALQALRIQPSVTLAAAQTWNIANANTNGNPTGLNKNEDLAFNPTGTGFVVDLGGFSVTKIGAGTAAFSLGITVTSTVPGGVFDVNGGVLLFQSGGSRTTTITDTVTINANPGGNVQFFAESGANGVAIESAAHVRLNGGTLLMQANQAPAMNFTGNLTALANSTWNFAGAAASITTFSGDLLGSANITHNNTATSNRVIMTGNNGAYSGTFTLNGASGSRALRLASENAGSAAATWVVNADNIIEVDNVSVQLGTLNGAGLVTTFSGTSAVSIGAGNFSGVLSNGGGTLAVAKVGGGTLVLTGPNTYTGPTHVESGALVTTSAQTGATTVTVADGATFGVQMQTAGTTFEAESITTGTISGAEIRVDTLGLGNPTAPVMRTEVFEPVAPTTFSILGSGLTSGVVRLLEYAGTMGGGGFPNLSVTLPFRISGNLIDNAAEKAVDVSLNVETPRWNGDESGDWDIEDSLNWRTQTSNTATHYFQGADTDSVLFTDAAEGTTVVNLTTTLTPDPGVTVNNDQKVYTFTGSGKLSGASALTKIGPGVLILANTTAYDHMGGTFVSGGAVHIGDGTTVGAGILPVGGLTNNAAVVLNRPDDFSGIITGNGTIVKLQESTATIVNPFAFEAPIAVEAGTLRFTGGGNLSGIISGAGAITSEGGIFQISGATPNSHTGPTTVAAGTMQFNKTPGVNAVGGNVIITGSGILSLLASEQIPDGATLTFTGTSGDSLAGMAAGATETIANAVVNPSVPTGQLILRNNFTITDTAVVQNGILGVASGHNATVNAINMSGGLVRIAGSGGASALNLGPGGLTASGGEVQVKFNTNDQDAVLNLGGDVIATGNLLFSNAGYNGGNLNVINLLADRVFHADAFTTTTIQPDLTGVGGLTKTGEGTLLFTAASSAAYSGQTQIKAGTLEVVGSLSGSDVTINGGILAGTGSIIPGAGGILLGEDGKLSPGAAFTAGTLSVNLVAGGSLDLSHGVAPTGSNALLFDLTFPGVNDRVNITGGPLAIGGGMLEFNDFVFSVGFGFDPTSNYTLFDGDSVIFGTLGEQTVGLIAGQFYELQFGDDGKDLVLVSIPEPGTAAFLLCGLGALGLRRRRK